MLIETLQTKGGLPFPVTAINVLIGPSGSGKTQALLDIIRLLTRQDPSEPGSVSSNERVEELPPTVVIEDGQFVSPLTESRLLRGLHVEEREGAEPLVQGLSATLDRAEQYVVRRETWNVIQRPVLSVSSVAKTELGGLLSMRAAYLPAIGRRNLVAPVGSISPLEAPHSLLQRLQWNADDVEDELNKLVGDLFDVRIALDVAQHTQIALRVLPGDSEVPRFESTREEARFFDRFPTVDRFQDGVANLVAIGVTVLMSSGSVVLVDVPEMGLHPDACRQLGRWLAETAGRRGVQLFLATHSAELIEGLQEGGSDLSAIRLSKTSPDTFTARPVSSRAMSVLKSSPYFSPQRPIAAIFHDAVVITDNEVERSVYRAAFLETSPVAHRITFFQSFGLVGLDAIAETVVESGIRHIVLSNLELLGMRARFHRLLEILTGDTPPPGLLAARDKIAGQVEEVNTQQSLATNTQEVEAFLDQLNRGPEEVKTLASPDERAKRWRALREKGLVELEPELRASIDELVDELKTLGLFLAPVGQARNWFDVESRSKWFEESLWKMQREGAPPPLEAFLKEILFYLGEGSGS